MGKFLDPSTTKPNLIAASLFIAAFEAVESSIIDRISDFLSLTSQTKERDEENKKRYQTEVLSRNRSPLFASLYWLVEMDCLDSSDLAEFVKVKDCRNKLAHELLSLVVSASLPAEFYSSFEWMIKLLNKIEVWWITQVEIPCNPDFDHTEIEKSEIIPGPIMGL